MKGFQRILAGVILVFVVQGCQKDDICPEATQTTPLLKIEFYDALDPSRLKAVENLVVQAKGEEVFLGPETVNNILIPLRTTENVTEYLLTYNSGEDTENVDTISISYDPALDYLNRACGYRVEFRNIDANTIPDEDNWIVSETILQENVENEEEVHISIAH